jgi:predicted nucleic-acid-binding Zn-ribbon protein
MDTQKKCLRCGSTNLTPSELQSTGKIYSRPKDSKAVTIFTSGAELKGTMCMDCGHVELWVDVAKAKSIAREAAMAHSEN